MCVCKLGRTFRGDLVKTHYLNVIIYFWPIRTCIFSLPMFVEVTSVSVRKVTDEELKCRIFLIMLSLELQFRVHIGIY